MSITSVSGEVSCCGLPFCIKIYIRMTEGSLEALRVNIVLEMNYF